MAGTEDLAEYINSSTGLLTQPPESSPLPNNMEETLENGGATTGSTKRKSRLKSGRSTKSVLEETLLRPPEAAIGPGAEDDSNTKQGTPPSCDQSVAEVKAAKTQLDLLKDKGGNVKKLTRILRDLSGRDDIDYRVLLTTGIGKTMNKLTNHKSAKVSELAL
ncbi:hypothetical protein THAOC_11600, partial [Thalassiosira oceanica]